jgi:hypothetical protein
MSFTHPPTPTWPTVEQATYLESRLPEYLQARTESSRAMSRVCNDIYIDFNSTFPVHDRTIQTPEDVVAYSAEIYDKIKGRKKVCTVRIIIIFAVS